MSVRDLGARLDLVLPLAVSDAVDAMVARRHAGEPLQYVLGTWAFRTLEVDVDRRALIPRPETEQVVEAALDELRAQALRLGPSFPLVAADLGSGSGVIAMSLACEFAPLAAALEVWATDLSADAVELCNQNRAALALKNPVAAGRLRVALDSWFHALPVDLVGKLQLVVSNPPYVSRVEWDALEPVVRDYEPVDALVPGPTGLEAIEVLLVEATRWLAPGGSLVVELAPGQAHQVLKRATELGYVRPEVRADLSGRQRMLVTRSPGG